jgi:hypothetical protein
LNRFAHLGALWYRSGVKIVVPFGARAVAADQTSILQSALDNIRSELPSAVFDLDSTTLSNKPRQARIVREFGRARGVAPLTRCEPAMVVSWDLRDTMRLCGLPEDDVRALHAPLREFWFHRFFTSDYCKDDEPIAGARDYLQRVLGAGGHILYVTGRHAGMEAGTLESFRRAGFPLPENERVQLWLKPDPDEDDDLWKETCQRRLANLRGVACAFDNEPTHVNTYKRAFPRARVVHLDTDHSGRPVEVRSDVPSVVDFRMAG